MNDVTLPPWLAPWAGGLVYEHGQRGYKPGERLRPRLTIYAVGHERDGAGVPILSWSGSAVAAEASASPLGAMGAGGTAVRWERLPLDTPPWNVDVPVPVRPEIIDRPPLLERAEVETAVGAAAWSGVVRGWAAGAALLALLVVIARLAEHLLGWKYLLRRRRMQRDWQGAGTGAGVHATCQEGFVVPGDAEAGPCSVDLPPPRGADLPPPYSELSPGGGAPKVEEPPPPYAEGDSCVRFINKNGIPVLVLNRARAALDPAGRRHVQRILQAAGIDLATLGTPPLAPGLQDAQDEPDSPVRFNPTSVISIITNDDEVETCVIGDASAPKDVNVEEGSSEGTSADNGASAAETTAANTDGGNVGPEDGAVAV